uniref:KIB1-4 beta-propeller domain-containing protein n=1 Tax=Aegilops tauschii TaxID=37682 RepID=M8BRE9_AEGTA
MEPIKPTADLTSKVRIQHEPADSGDAANRTIGGLPYHLTEKILGCIRPLESMHLATICKSWAGTVSERLARPTPHLFALNKSKDPQWFQYLLPPENKDHRGAIFSLPVDAEDPSSPVAPATCPPWSATQKVYRLDVEGARWVKVERLAADRTLFVSEQSSFTLSASELLGCMSNCIYFVGEVDSCCWVTWDVYSMEVRKVLFQHPIGGFPEKYDVARWFLPAFEMPLAHAHAHCTHSGKNI